jgi:hypothetical protein
MDNMDNDDWNSEDFKCEKCGSLLSPDDLDECNTCSPHSVHDDWCEPVGEIKHYCECHATYQDCSYQDYCR